MPRVTLMHSSPNMTDKRGRYRILRRRSPDGCLRRTGLKRHYRRSIRPSTGGDAWDWPDFAWEDARIEVLDALGRGGEAQADRWSCFERALSIPHLRAYLKRLPGFDDFEAEERALDYAQSYENPLRALSFLVSWPALDRAAALTIRRAAALDGNHYELLAPAADAMAGKYPLAATLAFRSMIDFALTHRRSSRYKHAARHFMACSSLASAIEDFGAY